MNFVNNSEKNTLNIILSLFTFVFILININTLNNPIIYLVIISLIFYLLVVSPISYVIKNRITNNKREIIFYMLNHIVKFSFIIFPFLYIMFDNFYISYEFIILIGVFNLFLMYYSSKVEEKIVMLSEEKSLRNLVDVKSFESEEAKLKAFYKNYVELNNNKKSTSINLDSIALDNYIKESKFTNYIYSILSMILLIVFGTLYYLFREKQFLDTIIILSTIHPFILIYTSKNKIKFIKDIKAMSVFIVMYISMMYFYFSPFIIFQNENISIYRFAFLYIMFTLLAIDQITSVNEESTKIQRILTEKHDRKIRVEMMNEQIRMQEELLYNKDETDMRKEVITNKYGGIVS